MQFITFSRKMGARGSEIARRVAGELGFSIHDTETIESMARKMGFLDDVRGIDERPPSIFKRFLSHRPEVQADRLNSVMYELASQGSAVFLGRGSHMLLRSYECAFHVRVTASLEHRIQQLIQRGIPREASEKMIARSDYERGRFVKLFYDVDWENSELYDIVLNMDHISVDLAVDTIAGMARSEEIVARSEDAIQSLEMMGLAQRAEAALIEATYAKTLSVSVPKPGCVQLHGVLMDLSSKNKMEEVLREVKGVQTIDNQIHVMASSYGA